MGLDRGLILAQRLHLLVLDTKNPRALKPEMENKTKWWDNYIA